MSERQGEKAGARRRRACAARRPPLSARLPFLRLVFCSPCVCVGGGRVGERATRRESRESARVRGPAPASLSARLPFLRLASRSPPFLAPTRCHTPSPNSVAKLRRPGVPPSLPRRRSWPPRVAKLSQTPAPRSVAAVRRPTLLQNSVAPESAWPQRVAPLRCPTVPISCPARCRTPWPSFVAPLPRSVARSVAPLVAPLVTPLPCPTAPVPHHSVAPPRHHPTPSTPHSLPPFAPSPPLLIVISSFPPAALLAGP